MLQPWQKEHPDLSSIMSHVEWLLSEEGERKRMKRVKVFRGTDKFAPCIRGGS